MSIMVKTPSQHPHLFDPVDDILWLKWVNRYNDRPSLSELLDADIKDGFKARLFLLSIIPDPTWSPIPTGMKSLRIGISRKLYSRDLQLFCRDLVLECIQMLKDHPTEAPRFNREYAPFAHDLIRLMLDLPKETCEEVFEAYVEYANPLSTTPANADQLLYNLFLLKELDESWKTRTDIILQGRVLEAESKNDGASCWRYHENVRQVVTISGSGLTYSASLFAQRIQFALRRKEAFRLVPNERCEAYKILRRVQGTRESLLTLVKEMMADMRLIACYTNLFHLIDADFGSSHPDLIAPLRIEKEKQNQQRAAEEAKVKADSAFIDLFR